MPSQPSRELETFENPAPDRDYEIAVSAYVLDGTEKLSSAMSNVQDVAATFEPECFADDLG